MPSEQKQKFRKERGDGHVPPASVRTESGATAAANPQHPERSRAKGLGREGSVLWENWQNRPSDSEMFSEDVMSPGLASPRI